MKKQFMVIALCALMCMVAGCKSDPQKDPTNPDTPVTPVDPPAPTETLKGNIARPTWTTPTDYDYTSSMTAVLKVDLLAAYPELAKDYVLQDKDLLAAFIGDKCLGVASPTDGLFYMYIVGSEGSVTLQYWSAFYSNTFVAKNAFDFQNDAHLGTVSKPVKPSFVVTGK